MVSRILGDIEKKLGLPPLSKALEKLPDAEQLKLAKATFEIVQNLVHEVNAMPSEKLERVERILAVVYELYSMPAEKLDKVEKILKRIEKIIKAAPEQLLTFLEKLGKED